MGQLQLENFDKFIITNVISELQLQLLLKQVNQITVTTIADATATDTLSRVMNVTKQLLQRLLMLKCTQSLFPS